MAETGQNITLYAGDTKDIEFRVSGVVTLAGSQLKWGLSRGATKTPIVSKTSSSGITVSGTVATVRVSPSDTENLLGRYYHELEVTDGSGNIYTTAIGRVRVIPTVN